MIKQLFQLITAIAGGIAIAVPSMVPANDDTRYSPLAQINKDNVSDLQVAWTAPPDVLSGHEDRPLVIGDTMFVHTLFPNKVSSINLTDQSINWSYVPKQDGAATIPVMCCDTVYRGLAYAEGKIFLQQADTTLVALDANTGKVLWKAVNGDPGKGETNTNSPIVVQDLEIDGEMRKVLVHFDRNGFAYTLDRETGKLLAEKYEPTVNRATHVDMETGRPQVVAQYSTDQQGEDVNTQNICPAALGSKDQQPAAYSPRTGLFYVPTNHVCMDYEPFLVEYVAGQPYVGATLSMFPAGRVMNNGTDHLGNFIAWDAAKGEIVWSLPEAFSVWSGALATGGDVVFYGTLDGYLKAVDANSGAELYSFKTPSGIIGNVNTWTYNGKQYVGVLSGIGGWAGIGMAAGLEGDTDGLGAVGAYKGLSKHTQLGGVLTVLAIP